MRNVQINLPLAPLESVLLAGPDGTAVRVWIKRDDLMHPLYGGNKIRKLYPNITSAISTGKRELVTFGGPFSNHVFATAAMCDEIGIDCTIYIRGEIDDPDNPVLTFVRNTKARLVPLPRREFAMRNDDKYLAELSRRHPYAIIVPEGGSNVAGIGGCGHIAREVQQQLGAWPEHIFVAAGTGGTAWGIAAAVPRGTRVHAIVAIEPAFFHKTFEDLESKYGSAPPNLEIDFEHHFGGLAKRDAGLLERMQEAEMNLGFLLDPVYTAKAWLALLDFLTTKVIEKDHRVVFVHTGGMAGREACYYRYGRVNS